MCRNIKTLFNFDPPATLQELQAAAEQYVRKVSGFHTPSEANQKAFNKAIADVTAATEELMQALTTKAPPRDREQEAAKAHERALKRFGK